MKATAMRDADRYASSAKKTICPVAAPVFDCQWLAQFTIEGKGSIDKPPFGNTFGIEAVIDGDIPQMAVTDVNAQTLPGGIQRHRTAGVIGAWREKGFRVVDLIDDRHIDPLVSSQKDLGQGNLDRCLRWARGWGKAVRKTTRSQNGGRQRSWR